MSSVEPATMSQPPIPDDFHEWSPEAQRTWLAGGCTKVQMLDYASEQLGLGLSFPDSGTVTNRQLARFLVALLESEGGRVDP